MPTLPPPALNDTEADELKAALASGQRLRRLPLHVEAAFRRHYQARISELLRKYVDGVVLLLLLIVVPIYLFRHEQGLYTWLGIGVAPAALVVAALRASVGWRRLEAGIDLLLGAGLFIALTGSLLAAMHLDGHYLGQLSKYIAGYILIVAFAILQLPARVATPVALASLLVALVTALALGDYPFWLEVFMYFGGPLLICTVTGYIQESSERRNFLQTLLLHRDSQRLAQLHADAEANTRQQRFAADYLALISGNLPLKEIFTRSLRFLVEHTDAQVGAGYHLSSRGRLRRVAAWALDGEGLQDKKEVAPEDTLMGPALARGELLHLRQVPAGYLPVDLGLGRLPCAELLVLPIVQAGRALAVIELGKVTPFSDEERARADAIRPHLAYAVAAANAREIALRASVD